MSGCNEDDSSIPINTLPEELIVAIFKLLALEDIVACENVCRRWKKLARDPALWRRIPIVYSGKPGQSEVSERSLEIINTHKECVHNLKLQYIYSYPMVISVIEKCPNLVSLELVMCRVCKEFEDDVRQWRGLKKLNMKNSLLLTSNDDLAIQFDQFESLSFLSLSDFGLSSINCKSLLVCKNLCHILIEKIKGLHLEFIKELIVSKQKILKTLHIYGGDAVDDKCLHLLSQCAQLRDLAIIRCENLTDEGLLSLTVLKQIEHLQVWNNINFSEYNLLKTLGSDSMTKLQSLSLSRIRNISPLIVDLISEYYKNLKFLAVYQCPRIINTDYEKQLKSKFRNIDVVLY
ncbi:hypothetical protein K1T71_006671 [Dendrolimus kikuchii]|uniref:Uncharacterized protein n=1 Tax=Dendrolimus kikuchii TaxID=765133 RepID=A0ACC1D1N7_9NEOP|nr:hypothetical protein K1T71_006671 [Dendrolimus kikuchii]